VTILAGYTRIICSFFIILFFYPFCLLSFVNKLKHFLGSVLFMNLFLWLDHIKDDVESIQQCGTDEDAGQDVGKPVYS